MAGAMNEILDELTEAGDLKIDKERKEFLALAFSSLYKGENSKEEMKRYVQDYYEYLSSNPEANKKIDEYYQNNKGKYVEFVRNYYQALAGFDKYVASSILPEGMAKQVGGLIDFVADKNVGVFEWAMGVNLGENPELGLIEKYDLKKGKELKDQSVAFFDQYAPQFSTSFKQFYKLEKSSQVGYENRLQQKEAMFEQPSLMPDEKAALGIRELHAFMFDRWFKEKISQRNEILDKNTSWYDKVTEIFYGPKERSAEEAFDKMKDILVNLYIYNGFSPERAEEMYDKMQKDLLDHYLPSYPSEGAPQDRLQKDYVDFLENNANGYKKLEHDLYLIEDREYGDIYEGMPEHMKEKIKSGDTDFLDKTVGGENLEENEDNIVRTKW